MVPHHSCCAPEEKLLYTLEDPIRVHTCWWNILETTFEGMERAAKQERFEKLCRMYLHVCKLHDPASLPNVEPG